MIAITLDEKIIIYPLYRLGLIPVDISKVILKQRMEKDLNEMVHVVIGLLPSNATNEVIK